MHKFANSHVIRRLALAKRRQLHCAIALIFFSLFAHSAPVQRTQSEEITADKVDKGDLTKNAWNAKKRFFIVVAVDKYRTSDSDLPFAAADGQKVKELFQRAQYVELGTLTGPNATRDAFIDLLKAISTSATQ